MDSRFASFTIAREDRYENVNPWIVSVLHNVQKSESLYKSELSSAMQFSAMLKELENS